MSSEHSELRTIKHRLSEILPRVGAAILCCVAVTLTVLNVQRAKSRTQEADTTPQKLVQDWRSYGSDGDWLGPRTAKLVVIEFSDYECSACGVLAGRLAALQKRLPSFSIVVRQFPLPLHIVGTNAARAAKCASAAGHFDQFESRAFSLVSASSTVDWNSYARAIGIADTASFDRCLHGQWSADAVNVDLEAGQKLGIVGTPTLLIGNEEYVGVPWDLEAIVTRHLRGNI